MTMLRPVPFLRWAGSKRQLVKTLSSYWDDTFGRYVEPFAGSACLFFHVQPSRAILGDQNEELIATYKEIKCRPEYVAKRLRLLKKSKTTYYRIRKQSVRGLSSIEQAARFIYLNRCCFNGLYRTNLKGEFNVPYGGDGSGSIPSAETLKVCST